jgi:SAM-dependent methyltransferase
MRSEEIKRKIDSFPTWHYEFELGGHITPIFNEEWVNRHEQRRRYFFEPLVQLCGGSLAGKRLLDLGCNAGFWSLQAIEEGCEFVLGIDGRQMHVDQANFVFEAKGVDRSRYHFEMGNVFDFDYGDFGAFDIVLCLGLLYHVSKPINLLELISAVNDDILVIDTDVSLLPGSYLRVKSEDVENPRHATERDLVMVPTRKAVLDVVGAFGYSVVVLRPEFSNYEASRKYRQGRRRAFLCAKKTSLTRLAAPTERSGATASMRDYLWLARDNFRKLPRVARRPS